MIIKTMIVGSRSTKSKNLYTAPALRFPPAMTMAASANVVTLFDQPDLYRNLETVEGVVK